MDKTILTCGFTAQLMVSIMFTLGPHGIAAYHLPIVLALTAC